MDFLGLVDRDVVAQVHVGVLGALCALQPNIMSVLNAEAWAGMLIWDCKKSILVGRNAESLALHVKWVEY